MKPQKYRVAFKGNEHQPVIITEKNYNDLKKILEHVTFVEILGTTYARSVIDSISPVESEPFNRIEEHNGPVISPERAREIRASYIPPKFI